MSRAIIIANQKGGIGKSTTALNIGSALAEKGLRVLLIDLDPQGGLSAAAGIDSYHMRRSAYPLLMHETVTFDDVTCQLDDQVTLIPSSIEMAHAEVYLNKAPNPLFRLKRHLDNHRHLFDFIIMDTPPTLGVLTANALLAGEELLIPVQCQFLAMRSVRAILDTLKHIQKQLNPDLKLLGVLATLYHPAFVHSIEALQELRQVFGSILFQNVIAFADVLAEAPIVGKSVLAYAPNHPVADAYRGLADEIIQRGNHHV